MSWRDDGNTSPERGRVWLALIQEILARRVIVTGETTTAELAAMVDARMVQYYGTRELRPTDWGRALACDTEAK